MIQLDNIQSLSDFRQNAKHYVDQLKATKSPLVLTVNGKAAVVVEDAESFEETQSRLEQLEEELRRFKLEALQRDVEKGIQQIQRGEGIPAAQVFEELHQKSQELREQS